MALAKWLQGCWQTWMTAHSAQRLPHAVAIAGVKGLGKRALADHLAAYLLCNNVQANAQVSGACGECKSCGLLQAQSHPDLQWVEPEEPGRAILVSRVREIQPWLATTAQQGGNKVVIIDPANSMNLSTANALLKHLEEPNSGTYFLLIHHKPQALLSTIQSRCQTYNIPTPNLSLAKQWLQQQNATTEDDIASALSMAAGAPLTALQYIQDNSHTFHRQVLVDLTAILRNRTHAPAVAAVWVNHIRKAQTPDLTQQLLGWWLGWMQDLIRLMQTQDPECIPDPSIRKLLQAIAKKTNIHKVYALHDNLMEDIVAQRMRRNFNTQLMFETLLCDWYCLV